MTPEWFAVAGAGLAILVASIVGARHDFIPPWEARLFHAVNGLPGFLYWILWPFMQLGNLVVGTLVGLVCALVAGEWSVAVGVILAMLLKLVTERIVRHEVKNYLEVRERPGSSQTDAILRGGDVPHGGPSFPSGHVILVAAVACVVAPTIPASLVWIPFVAIALVMIGRVYVGAHNPLDVTSGLGAGLLLGGVLAAFVG